MEPVVRLTSRVVPLPRADVDTDQIIPARFLSGTDRACLGDALFADWRLQPDFVLNQSRYQGAQVLLGGANFGCGSSREHAVWALHAWGIRAVLAPSFADIFASNAVNAGVVPVRVDSDLCGPLLEAALSGPGLTVTLDVAAQTLETPDGLVSFALDAIEAHRLTRGLEPLDHALEYLREVNEFETARSAV
ncbi:MAG: 3-isopropylmalate/(R)-2-methylmalate dehydratase small subunit [Myxococcota bacterium]|jgi:3-isopropylmalate/(R)-2-methylmalate dehydratase small subunit